MWNLIFIALIIGGLMPLQAAINTQLATWLKHPLQAAFFSFLGGTLILGLCTTVLPQSFPSLNKLGQIPWYLWLGGLLGSVFVSSAIFLVPKIGTTLFLAAAVAGQMMISLIIDHYGHLGVPTTPASFLRILGAMMLVGGVILIQKF